ncbi:MAG TPA: hypothetical protein VLT88_13050, partial [Desulfosarcina sp.]|nr:hypothetical protein [Desulfosarcina sp.]
VKADRLEAEALESLFEGEPHPLVTSLKGALGENHASGGIRSAGMAISLHNGIVPPTLGLADPIASLAMVTGKFLRADVEYGLVNACASGGTFASLLLKRAG